MKQESEPFQDITAASSNSIATAKAELRRVMRGKRTGLSTAERSAASAAICARLLNLNVLEPRLHQHTAPVAVYLAKSSEASIDSFIEELLGKRVAVAAPRQVADDEVSFYTLRDLHSTPRPGKFGVRSPLEYAGGKAYGPRRLGVVLTPGLAFDRTGGRLGQGGGWYDRVLPFAKLSIGICFDCQLLDSVPQEAHDARVDMIVTESQTIDVSGRATAYLKTLSTNRRKL